MMSRPAWTRLLWTTIHLVLPILPWLCLPRFISSWNLLPFTDVRRRSVSGVIYIKLKTCVHLFTKSFRSKHALILDYYYRIIWLVGTQWTKKARRTGSCAIWWVIIQIISPSYVMHPSGWSLAVQLFTILFSVLPPYPHRSFPWCTRTRVQRGDHVDL